MLRDRARLVNRCRDGVAPRHLPQPVPPGTIASMELSQTAARRFLLDYHFLLPPRTLAPRTGVLTVLERLRCVQVDPLDLVGTNPHLVLQSRITDYSPALLERHLYEHRELVETFDKERSIVPVADWAGLSSSRRAVRALRGAPEPSPRGRRLRAG